MRGSTRSPASKGRGRPPLPRGVVAFDAADWSPPDAVILDTNVVAEALLPNEPEHVECLALIERLAQDEVVTIFNRLLEVELYEVLFNLALRERHPRKELRNVRYDDRVRPRAARILNDGRKAWAELKSALTWGYLELEEVMPRVAGLMTRYGLQSYDAVHAATAIESGITDFVTRDAGFAKLPPRTIRLHTTEARLGNTRARRRRAGY